MNLGIDCLYSQLNLIPGTSSKYYEVSFGNIYDNTKDQAAFNTELCKKFTIRYRYNKIDTVQTCFKAKKNKVRFCIWIFKGVSQRATSHNWKQHYNRAHYINQTINHPNEKAIHPYFLLHCSNRRIYTNRNQVCFPGLETIII